MERALRGSLSLSVSVSAMYTSLDTLRRFSLSLSARILLFIATIPALFTAHLHSFSQILFTIFTSGLFSCYVLALVNKYLVRVYGVQDMDDETLAYLKQTNRK